MGFLSDPFGTKKAARIAAAEAEKAAGEAQRAEERRQNRIRNGTEAVDRAYAQFNPGFFDNYSKTYSDFYNPQVDRQYDRAKDKLTAQLAGQGVLESGVGNQAMSDLATDYQGQRSNIASQAAGAVNALKGNINASKTGLYTAAQAAGDPQQLASQAVAASTALAAPQSYSPLADLFAGALNTYGAYRNASMYAPSGGSFNPEYGAAMGSGGGGGGGGGSSSVSVIR